MENFIDKYVDLVSEFTDAPLNSIMASVYWLISATLGLWFDIKETPSLGTRCNIFVLLCGRAGITRKSTVMSYARTVYKIAWSEFYKHIGIDIDIDDKFCEEFTLEGIADQVEEVMSYGISDFVLMTDEFGIWLARTDSTHLLGSRGLLSKLYYGESYKQSLSRRGGKKGSRKIPEGLYWTLFAGMQDPDLYLNEMDIKQGFLRRFLLVNVTEEDLREYQPPLSPKHRYIKHKLVELGKELAKRMLDIYRFTNSFEPIETYFSQTVVDSINEYDMNNFKTIKKIYSTDSVVSRYMITAWEHVLKLTVLRAIADFNTKPVLIAGEPVYNVMNISHFEKAKTWFDSIKPRMIEAIESIAVNKENPTLPSMDNVANSILGTISRAGGSMTTGELLRRLGTTKAHIKPYLVTLVEQGRITPVYHIKNKGIIVLFLNESDADKYISQVLSTKPTAIVKKLSASVFSDIWR